MKKFNKKNNKNIRKKKKKNEYKQYTSSDKRLYYLNRLAEPGLKSTYALGFLDGSLPGRRDIDWYLASVDEIKWRKDNIKKAKTKAQKDIEYGFLIEEKGRLNGWISRNLDLYLEYKNKKSKNR